MVQPEKPKEENQKNDNQNIDPEIESSTSSEARDLFIAEDRKQRKLDELAQKKESGEVAGDNFDCYGKLYLEEMDLPLTKASLGGSALVLTRGQFEAIGSISIVLKSGQEIDISPEQLKQNDVLIIYPSDLGDIE